MTPVRTTRRQAFTLTEVVVVLAICAVLSGGIWRLLVGNNRSFEESSAHIAATRSALLAIEWIRKDLCRLAVPRPHPLDPKPQRPIRMASAHDFEVSVLKPVDLLTLGLDTKQLELETVRYRLVPRGEPGEGFYRNDRRLTGVVLDRFEAALVTDPATGAPFLRLVVVGTEPAGFRSVVLQDLIFLEALENLRRHPSSVPNAFPNLQPLPDDPPVT